MTTISLKVKDGLDGKNGAKGSTPGADGKNAGPATNGEHGGSASLRLSRVSNNK